MEKGDYFVKNYPFRRIPVRLWDRLKVKADSEGITLREKLLRLIEQDVKRPR